MTARIRIIICIDLTFYFSRRTVELSKPPKHVKEKEEACMEVQSLTDNVAHLPPSGVAQKIQESRKTRYASGCDFYKVE